MKPILPVLCASLLLASTVAFSQTVLTDLNSSGSELTSSGNPYIVKNDLVVPPGKKMVIREGCVILFAPYNGLIVEGTLAVEGSAENPVIFTTIHDTSYNLQSVQAPSAFDWNGILIKSGAKNVSFRNFCLLYSVFGIKTQTPDLFIEQGNFRNNGQFHFAISDKVQLVQDNISFSYHGNSAEALKSTQPQVAGNQSPSRKIDTNRSPEEKKRWIRYGFAGGSLVGGGVGIGFTVAAAMSYERLKNLQNESFVEGEYDRRNSRYHGQLTGAIIGGAAAALLLGGFGLTFAF